MRIFKALESRQRGENLKPGLDGRMSPLCNMRNKIPDNK